MDPRFPCWLLNPCWRTLTRGSQIAAALVAAEAEAEAGLWFLFGHKQSARGDRVSSISTTYQYETRESGFLHCPRRLQQGPWPNIKEEPGSLYGSNRGVGKVRSPFSRQAAGTSLPRSISLSVGRRISFPAQAEAGSSSRDTCSGQKLSICIDLGRKDRPVHTLIDVAKSMSGCHVSRLLRSV